MIYVPAVGRRVLGKLLEHGSRQNADGDIDLDSHSPIVYVP